MSKNLLLLCVVAVVVVVAATVGTLIGIGSLDSATGLPILSGAITLVLGAFLALLDPKS